MRITPKIKQTPGADLEGGLLYTEEGRPYSGPYVQDSTGRFFTGSFLTKDSKPLIRYFEEGDEDLYPENTFIVFYLKVDTKTRSKGYVERYFLQHPVSKRIKEVSKESFQKEKRTDRTQPFLFYQCTWYLTPDLVKRNEKSMEEGEKVMKGLKKQVLTSPLQFVE